MISPIFLVTILSCGQVVGMVDRLQKIAILSSEQKTAIIKELRKSVPSCPIIIKQENDTKGN